VIVRPSAIPHGAGRELLVLQRNRFAARAIARFFEPLFDAVHVATSLAEADALLRDPSHRVTHVVCGQRFGDGDPEGADWIAAWRARHPTVRRVVLLTADVVASEVAGIDLVLEKPLDPAALAAVLSGPIAPEAS
jgi:CheY-like chemotaxis protein